MTNVTRPENNAKTDLVYYVQRKGNTTTAADAVAALNRFNDRELTLRLGYVVEKRAERKSTSFLYMGIALF